MLPPFHGERMRAYEATVRDVVERDVAGWPRGEAFAVHPRMQAVTLEVIVRAVFGVTDPVRGERLRELLRGLLDATASFGLQFGFMLARRVGAPDPLEKLRRQRAEIDELLLAEIGERRADRAAARTSSRCCWRRASRTASRWPTRRSATSS